MQIIRVKGINGLGKTKGCEKAPVDILKALEDIYTNEKGKVIDKKLLELEEIHLNNDKVDEANELIYKNALEAFLKQDKVFFMGGDHSISYSLARAFKDSFKDPFLIVFDAHADCMPPIKEPTHEEWLRAIIEKGFLPEKIILLGVRNLDSQERIFLEQNKIKTIRMEQIQEDRQVICDMIMEKARKSEALYLSIDIDAVDPAHAPGTGYLEPGGLSSRELIYFLQRLALLKNFKAADIVEINPDKDLNGMTVKLGAKILSEII